MRIAGWNMLVTVSSTTAKVRTVCLLLVGDNEKDDEIEKD